MLSFIVALVGIPMLILLILMINEAIDLIPQEIQCTKNNLKRDMEQIKRDLEWKLKLIRKDREKWL